MIDTFQALGVAVLALLPGASYIFAYERIVGSFGVSFSDRLVRFLAASAIYHAIFAGPELLLYRHVVQAGIDSIDIRRHRQGPIEVGNLAGRLVRDPRLRR